MSFWKFMEYRMIEAAIGVAVMCVAGGIYLIFTGIRAIWKTSDGNQSQKL